MTTRKICGIAVWFLSVGILWSSTPAAYAHKQYMDALKAKYPKVAEQVNLQKCTVCHGKQKVQRSDFARALEFALGGKKIRNVPAINTALDKVAELKSEVPEKTYGDLLGGGQLPPPFRAPPK